MFFLFFFCSPCCWGSLLRVGLPGLGCFLTSCLSGWPAFTAGISGLIIYRPRRTETDLKERAPLANGIRRCVGFRDDDQNFLGNLRNRDIPLLRRAVSGTFCLDGEREREKGREGERVCRITGCCLSVCRRLFFVLGLDRTGLGGGLSVWLIFVGEATCTTTIPAAAAASYYCTWCR